MNMKRFIACITSIAILLLSFNTAVFAQAAKPTATVGTTSYSAYELKGNYTYDATNANAEGVTEFKWYASDKLFGEYKEITGATSQTLNYTQYESGKYIKFVVIPVDVNGTKGEPVEANPVQTSKTVIETFSTKDSISSTKIEEERIDNGKYDIVADPVNTSNNVFMLNKTDTTSSTQTRVAYMFDTVSDIDSAIVDFKVYIDDLPESGTWEMMYLLGSDKAQRALKLYVTGTTLYLQGKSSKSLSGFTRDTWHQIKMVLDYKKDIIKEVIVDETVFPGSENLGFEKSASDIKYLRTFLQNANIGTCYMDDVSITTVKTTEGFAAVDLDAVSINQVVELNTDSIELPTVGTVNKLPIEWTSSNEDIITIEDGEAIVSRPKNPKQNEKVTLTAHAINGNDYAKKEFEIDVICLKSADLDEITSPVDGSSVASDFELKTTLSDGSTVTWTSSDPDVIKIDGTKAIVKRAYSEKQVTLTASSTIAGIAQKREYNLTVPAINIEFEPPTASDVKIAQYATTYVTGIYTYADQGDFLEGESIYKWYVEGASGYELVSGENSTIFAPSKDYDGKNIKFSVTPVSSYGTVGTEEFSESFKYTYYEPRKPVAKIEDVTVTENDEFVLEYSYKSDDYLAEGETEIIWSRSATLYGEYTPIQGATGTTYVPTSDHDSYYKVSVIPKDKFGTIGEKVEKGPFLYAHVTTNTILAVQQAIDSLSVVEKAYGDIKLPTSVAYNDSKITWVSSDPSLIATDGTVNRPSKEGYNTNVKLTAYVVCGFEIQTISFDVTVMKYTEKPVVTNQTLRQEPGRRPIYIDYVYTDADGNKEGNTIYEWYYKSTDENSTYVKIDGANLSLYAPDDKIKDGTFYAKITPVDSTKTVGETVITPELTYVEAPSVLPTAIMNPTQYKAFELIGDYTYQNDDNIPEGPSEFKWFIADNFFGPYEEIQGQTEKTLKYTYYSPGKYVKFAVIPKDMGKLAGDMVEADPVLISSQIVDGFETDNSLNSVNATSFAAGSGFTGIVANPSPDSVNSTDSVYKIQRLVTNEEADDPLRNSIIQYNIPKYQNPVGLIIDLDICAPANPSGGAWEAVYINGSGIVAKLYIAANGKLYFQTVTTTSPVNVTKEEGYIANKWNHIRVILDMENQVVKEISINGKVHEKSIDMPFRTNVNSIDFIRSYFQGKPTGTGYLDNIAVTPILKTENQAREDANMVKLNIETDSVISNFRLPLEGPENGSVITWESDNEDAVLVKGDVAIVSRPTDEDKTVTLTAHAVKGNDYFSRTFEVTVIRTLDDEQIAQHDADRLSQYDNMIVDSKMKFPTKGKFGATYTWKSSDESVIDNDGNVTQGNEKKDVTFTVTVTCGGHTTTREVTLTVAPVLTENLLIKGGIDASSAVTEYPADNAGDGDYTTNWQSLDIDKAPFVVMDMGKLRDVNRLYIADKAKSIKSITLYSSQDKTNWTPVTVINGIKDENLNMIEFETVNTRYIRANLVGNGAVTANEFRLMFDKNASGDASDVVTDITLPCGTTATADFQLVTQLSDGTKVVWTSSNITAIEIIGSTAYVHRKSTDQEVTLTATINVGGKITEKTFKVVVKGTDGGSGGGSGGGGGGGSRPSGATTAGGITTAPDITPTTQTSVFKDLASVPWAVEAINSLNAKGVVNGTSATTFHPSRNITREEFAAILYRGLALDGAQVSGKFTDVSTAAWYYEPVMKLSSLGIITGIGNDKFGTGKTITRQDMAVMIYRTALAVNSEFVAGNVYFEDGKSIAEYAKEAVGALAGAQIINGVGNNRFNPAGNATRAEATVILSRIMNYIK